MKIAIITDDGKTVSQHFGRAAYYLVLTIEDGRINNREMREKMGHNQFSATDHGEHHHEHHGTVENSHNKHTQMAASISDCAAVICGGMGTGAYESMKRLNINPIVTDILDVNIAAQSYIDEILINHVEKLH